MNKGLVLFMHTSKGCTDVANKIELEYKIDVDLTTLTLEVDDALIERY